MCIHTYIVYIIIINKESRRKVFEVMDMFMA